MPRGLEIIYGSQLGEFGVAKVDKIWILDPDPNVVIHGGAEKTINCELE